MSRRFTLRSQISFFFSREHYHLELQSRRFLLDCDCFATLSSLAVAICLFLCFLVKLPGTVNDQNKLANSPGFSEK